MTRRFLSRRFSIVSAALFGTILLLSFCLDAAARESYFFSDCSSCHNNDNSTCDGCHQHGNRSLTATPNKSLYQPGEEVIITLSGGSRGGWIRGRMTDHDGTENDRKTGPTFTGNDGGSEITFPLELRGYAPGVAGSYNWTTKYYGNNGSGTHSEVNVPATINVGSTSELVVDIIPETSPMFFGSGGGTINCDVYVENTTASPAAFDGWFDATLPNGFHYGPIFGPVSGTFPGNAHTTRPFSFSLPGGAPSGVYSLNVYLGDYDQSIVYDADSFTFVKE